MGNKNTKIIANKPPAEEVCWCYNCVLQSSSLKHSEPRMAVDSRKGYVELELCSRSDKIIIGKVVDCTSMASTSAPKESVYATSSDVGDIADEFLRREKFAAAISKPARKSLMKGSCTRRSGELYF